MADREKMIKGIEHCRKYGALSWKDCNGHYEYTYDMSNIIKIDEHRNDCPYGKYKTGCIVTLVDEALELLKEQEETINELNGFINGFSKDAVPVVRCKDCKCSEPHKTDIIWCSHLGVIKSEDWFCADGEQKEA